MAMKFEKKGEGHYLLDVKGYVCPHPQIYTKKAIERLKSGDILEVVFDNPSSAESISAMCDSTLNQIIEKQMEGGQFIFKIKKS